jgi:hypothetical protein
LPGSVNYLPKALGGPEIMGLMRLTEFWRRMGEAFDGHAQSIAELHVFSELGNRTPLQALDAGESAKDVWRAVCEAMEVPAAKR